MMPFDLDIAAETRVRKYGARCGRMELETVANGAANSFRWNMIGWFLSRWGARAAMARTICLGDQFTCSCSVALT
jgi:hypothetical protein